MGKSKELIDIETYWFCGPPNGTQSNNWIGASQKYDINTNIFPVSNIFLILPNIYDVDNIQ